MDEYIHAARRPMKLRLALTSYTFALVEQRAKHTGFLSMFLMVNHQC